MFTRSLFACSTPSLPRVRQVWPARRSFAWSRGATASSAAAPSRRSASCPAAQRCVATRSRSPRRWRSSERREPSSSPAPASRRSCSRRGRAAARLAERERARLASCAATPSMRYAPCQANSAPSDRSPARRRSPCTPSSPRTAREGPRPSSVSVRAGGPSVPRGPGRHAAERLPEEAARPGVKPMRARPGTDDRRGADSAERSAGPADDAARSGARRSPARPRGGGARERAPSWRALREGERSPSPGRGPVAGR